MNIRIVVTIVSGICLSNCISFFVHQNEALGMKRRGVGSAAKTTSASATKTDILQRRGVGSAAKTTSASATKTDILLSEKIITLIDQSLEGKIPDLKDVQEEIVDTVQLDPDNKYKYLSECLKELNTAVGMIKKKLAAHIKNSIDEPNQLESAIHIQSSISEPNQLESAILKIVNAYSIFAEIILQKDKKFKEEGKKIKEIADRLLSDKEELLTMACNNSKCFFEAMDKDVCALRAIYEEYGKLFQDPLVKKDRVLFDKLIVDKNTLLASIIENIKCESLHCRTGHALNTAVTVAGMYYPFIEYCESAKDKFLNDNSRTLRDDLNELFFTSVHSWHEAVVQQIQALSPIEIMPICETIVVAESQYSELFSRISQYKLEELLSRLNDAVFDVFNVLIDHINRKFTQHVETIACIEDVPTIEQIRRLDLALKRMSLFRAVPGIDDKLRKLKSDMSINAADQKRKILKMFSLNRDVWGEDGLYRRILAEGALYTEILRMLLLSELDLLIFDASRMPVLLNELAVLYLHRPFNVNLLEKYKSKFMYTILAIPNDTVPPELAASLPAVKTQFATEIREEYFGKIKRGRVEIYDTPGNVLFFWDMITQRWVCLYSKKCGDIAKRILRADENTQIISPEEVIQRINGIEVKDRSIRALRQYATAVKYGVGLHIGLAHAAVASQDGYNAFSTMLADGGRLASDTGVGALWDRVFNWFNPTQTEELIKRDFNLNLDVDDGKNMATALGWFDHATHTEAQLAALIANGICAPEPNIGVLSVLNPCESCQTIDAIANSSNEKWGDFHFFRLDGSTEANIETIINFPTTWEEAKNKVHKKLH
ncbi:MAG: hypothetical protein LBB21_01935 [Holosporaceae bacterium]|jgi:hypothetical protein|nr:hypothetical protein [Holosporaceae bacterium]